MPYMKNELPKTTWTKSLGTKWQPHQHSRYPCTIIAPELLFKKIKCCNSILVLCWTYNHSPIPTNTTDHKFLAF